MIQPNELRIRNILLYEGKPVKVESIDPDREAKEFGLKCAIGVMQYAAEYPLGITGRWLNHFEPIPLTPEWLERCGYEQVRKGVWANVLSKDEEHITEMVIYSLQVGCELTIASSDYSGYDVKLLHLHQLQNLIYSLTGKELTIKL